MSAQGHRSRFACAASRRFSPSADALLGSAETVALASCCVRRPGAWPKTCRKLAFAVRAFRGDRPRAPSQSGGASRNGRLRPCRDGRLPVGVRLLALVRYFRWLKLEAAGVPPAVILGTPRSGSSGLCGLPCYRFHRSGAITRATHPSSSALVSAYCPAGDLTLGVASVLLLVAGAVVVVPFVLLGSPEFGAPPDMPLAEPVAPGEP